ncbi:hypothetical protein EDC01DRAFT_358657 [Geopyxis carbonaria]|nr:hypothetical protein EDC01DRAFT_358657 [Geopyxis carbonaria]
MQAPMQPTSPRGSQVPASFGARRSISHDLARFSLDLGPHHKSAGKVPYPSPPMSHSPPPVHSLPPTSNRRDSRPGPSQYGNSHPQPNHHEPYSYAYDHQHQPTHPNTSYAPQAGYPAPFPAINNAPENAPQVAASSGRSPFVSGKDSFTLAPYTTPRRPKSHVASACVNCKKAHLACDNRRPCPRCVGLGKQESCVDVQHKKRGRPRLRDERAHSFEVAHMQRQGSVVSPLASPTTHRVIKAHPVDNVRTYRRSSLTPKEEVENLASSYFEVRSPRGPWRNDLPPQPPSPAVAYFTTDLVVAKSTEPLRELLGCSATDLDGFKSLFDIVLTTDRDKVYRLSSRIQEEMAQRGLKAHPSSQVYQVVQAIGEDEAAAAVQGSKLHSESLHLRHPNGQYLKIRIRANLAVTSVCYVVIVFSMTNEMPPPLQLNPSCLTGSGIQQSQHSSKSVQLAQPPLTSPSLITPSHHHHHQHVHPSPSVQPPLNSPSFLTSSHQRQFQAEPSGPQSPFAHPGSMQSSSIESRPRTMQPESSYSSLTPYMNPSSPASSTFHHHRAPISPATATPTGIGFVASGLQQSDLQLPPLLLKDPQPLSHPNHQRKINGEGEKYVQTPKRERIGVKEMLD